MSIDSVVDAMSGTDQDWREQKQQHPKQYLQPCRSILKNSSTGRINSSNGVKFSQKIQVHEIYHFRDLPPEEVVATWYTNDDFELIKKSLVATLRLMMTDKDVGEDQCVRGLEFRTPLGAKQRKQRKVVALTAVWNEQVRQWQEDIVDDEAIRRVYLQHSDPCREVARKFGVRDELAIQEYKMTDGDNSFSTIESTSVSSSILTPKLQRDALNKITSVEKMTTHATHCPLEVIKMQACVPSAA